MAEIPKLIQLHVPRPGSPGVYDWLLILPDQYLDLCRAILRIKNITDEKVQQQERAILDSLIQYGATITALPREIKLTPDDILRMVGTLAIIERLADIEDWRNDKDAVMSMCYHMVQTKKYDRTDAQTFAERLLHTKFTSRDNFAKSLLRWATAPQRELDPLPQGRPPKKTDT